MRKFGRFQERLRLFAGDRQGTFAVVFGAVSVVLVMAGGLALDTGQLLLTKSNLLNALDSAVTSTARDLTTGALKEDEARETIEAFLYANGGTGFASADKIKLDRIEVDRVKKTVSAQASVDVALVFPVFGGDPVRRVTVESAAVYSDKKIEVAMMLDVTGSMGKTWYNDKIGDLKAAASKAVEQLFKGQKKENPRVRVAIVPYAEAVNVGPALAGRAVFVEKEGGPDLPRSFEDPIQVSATASIDHCATERKLQGGSADFSDDAPNTVRINNAGKRYYAKVNRDDRITVVKNRRGQVVGTKCPSAQVVPLTTDKTKLLNAIDAFEADGFTAGGIAAQWGYYMLSPKWRQTIRSADLGDGPANYDDKKVAKIAILMTDGQFNTAFADSSKSRPAGNEPDLARNHAEAVCRNMKRDGIEVFTIGFALPGNEASDARSVLKNCATADSGALKHFYEAADGDELDTTFREIIANIERLHLTK